MSAYGNRTVTELAIGRGQFVFEQHDQSGRTAPNDLSNVIATARANGLKVGLRLEARAAGYLPE